MRCLREIARIRWQDKVPNTEVLTRCHTTGIEADLIRSQLRWCGHLIRMPDSRLPKAAFYSELKSGNRRLGRPLMRFKDSLKANLKVCSIDPKKWEELALNRPQWRRTCLEGISKFEADRISHLQEKRRLRKAAAESGSTRAGVGQYVCDICGRSCAAAIGLVAHKRSHQRKN